MIKKIVQLLEKSADLTWKFKGPRHALFAIATVLSILFVGYYFGTFDQTSHIPFLAKTIDPSLYPQDKYFDLRFTHYSFFWFLFIPFYKSGILEIAVFVVHVISIYLTFWALWHLSRALFKNPLVSLISVLAFVFSHITFAGFSIIEFSLLNRTFVLPFLLFALTLYFRGRYIWTFVILGITYNLHVVSVNFVLFMILFDYFLRFRTVGLRTILSSFGVFLLFAFPVLLWKFKGPADSLIIDWEWFRIIADSVLYNIFYIFSSHPHIIVGTVSGIAALALFFIGKKSIKNTEYSTTLTNFTAASLVILVIAILSAYFFPFAIIVQLQIIRIGVFVLILAYLCFANFAVREYESKRITQGDFIVLTASLMFSIFAFVPLVVWGIIRVIKNTSVRTTLGTFLIITAFVVILAISYQTNIWNPQIFIFPQKTSWYDTQMWAQSNTPKNALFITPPHKWWLYESDWRVFSKRSSVVTLSELLEAAFSPDYIPYWRERFNLLAPGALAQFRGNLFENKHLARKAFYSLSAADFERIGAKYNAEYLVVEKPYRYDFPIVFENKNFIIYKIPFKNRVVRGF